MSTCEKVQGHARGGDHVRPGEDMHGCARLYKGMQVCAKNVQRSVRPHESMGGNVNMCERVQVCARGCEDKKGCARVCECM